MFPAKPLFESMRRDPAFAARIVVVPDFRWEDRNFIADMERCARELREDSPGADVRTSSRNPAGVWEDFARNVDIVVYPLPYNQSDLRYNPRWAVGRPFLPIYLSYSFSTSLYGHWVYGLQSYACFWKVFVECEANARDYFPAFASCDAIVQDCGSYLVEWLYTGKPCCYMLKNPSDIDEKFTPLGKECLSHCYLAYDEPAIESFLRDVVEGGNDPKAAARDEFRKTVMVNYPHAADAALASIKRDLEMI